MSASYFVQYSSILFGYFMLKAYFFWLLCLIVINNFRPNQHPVGPRIPENGRCRSPVFDSIETKGPPISIWGGDERVPEVDEQPRDGRDVVEAVDALGHHQGHPDSLNGEKEVVKLHISNYGVKANTGKLSESSIPYFGLSWNRTQPFSS